MPSILRVIRASLSRRMSGWFSRKALTSLAAGCVATLWAASPVSAQPAVPGSGPALPSSPPFSATAVASQLTPITFGPAIGPPSQPLLPSGGLVPTTNMPGPGLPIPVIAPGIPSPNGEVQLPGVIPGPGPELLPPDVVIPSPGPGTLPPDVVIPSPGPEPLPPDVVIPGPGPGLPPAPSGTQQPGPFGPGSTVPSPGPFDVAPSDLPGRVETTGD
jgi:hypothetical protein